MAKSIRLKDETQTRVQDEARRLGKARGIPVRDAQMVELLVNEALDARETTRKAKVSR